MNKVLLTGGSGFVGSALCLHLVTERRVRVLNADKLTYAGVPASLAEIEGSPLYRFERADVCDRRKMAQLFSEFRPDVVMHLAAESHVDRSIDAPAAFIQTNVVGTCTLLECAREHWAGLSGSRKAAFRFLHVSTDEVYGSLGERGLFDEASPYAPRSPYSASKASADHLAKAWFHTYGLPVVVTNCSNNYGPRQFPEKLIPLLILNALEERELPIYGDGGNIRDWLHVEDHARALVAAAESGRVGETYNVGGRAERTNLEVAEAVCAAFDELRPRAAGRHRDLIRFVDDRPGHDRRYAIDPAKAEAELGWRAQESFDGGIRKTVRWYLDHPEWWRPLRTRQREAGT